MTQPGTRKSLHDHFTDSQHTLDEFYRANIVAAVTPSGRFVIKNRWGVEEKHMGYMCVGPVKFEFFKGPNDLP